MILQIFALTAPPPISNWQWFWENFAGSATGLFAIVAAIVTLREARRRSREEQLVDQATERFSMLQEKYGRFAAMSFQYFFADLVISLADPTQDEDTQLPSIKKMRIESRIELATLRIEIGFLDGDPGRLQMLDAIRRNIKQGQTGECFENSKQLEDSLREVADSLEDWHENALELAKQLKRPVRHIVISGFDEPAPAASNLHNSQR